MPNTYLLWKITARKFFENMTKKLEISNVDIDQGIHKVKYKVARNEKRKKLRGFSYI